VSQTSTLVLLACGDVGPMREPIGPLSELVRPILARADVRFAQCERTYSTRGQVQVQHEAAEPGHMTRQPPRMASVFRDCGFDVVSVATNVAMNWGPESYLDTIDLFSQMGIRTVGGGRNLAHARNPVTVEVHGVRIAFLAYCSIVRPGYAAGPASPGVAPMRARTYFEAIEYPPGTTPRVMTIPYEDDLRGLCEDIERARQQADVVIVSLHWGVHASREIADYQRTVMRAAIDHGAGLILGHHPHRPKGIEVYKGVGCFYGMSNFIMSTDKVGRDPTAPYGLDGKRSFIVRAEVDREGVSRLSFLPVLIDDALRPEVLLHSDPRFGEAVEYMEWASDGLPHKFNVEGDEVVVC